MHGAECVVASLHVVGMVDPCIEGEGGISERLVDIQQCCVEGEVEVTDVVSDTSGNGGSDGVVDFKVGDTSIGIHELEGNGDVGYGLATIVHHPESHGVFFKIDTSRTTRRANLGYGHIIVERRIDAHIDGGIVAGAVTSAEAAEVVERVVEVLRCIAPVCGTTVVVVTIVEEVATDCVAMPTDGTVGVLCSP